MMHLSVGNLPPSQGVSITVSCACQLATTTENWMLSLPCSLFPQTTLVDDDSSMELELRLLELEMGSEDVNSPGALSLKHKLEEQQNK